MEGQLNLLESGMEGKRTAINGWARFIIIIFNYVSKWSILSVSQQYQYNYVRNDVEWKEELRKDENRSRKCLTTKLFVWEDKFVLLLLLFIYVYYMYMYV